MEADGSSRHLSELIGELPTPEQRQVRASKICSNNPALISEITQTLLKVAPPQPANVLPETVWIVVLAPPTSLEAEHVTSHLDRSAGRPGGAGLWTSRSSFV